MLGLNLGWGVCCCWQQQLLLLAFFLESLLCPIIFQACPLVSALGPQYPYISVLLVLATESVLVFAISNTIFYLQIVMIYLPGYELFESRA